jgi:hypothetical protein
MSDDEGVSGHFVRGNGSRVSDDVTAGHRIRKVREPCRGPFPPRRSGRYGSDTLEVYLV